MYPHLLASGMPANIGYTTTFAVRPAGPRHTPGERRGFTPPADQMAPTAGGLAEPELSLTRTDAIRSVGDRPETTRPSPLRLTPSPYEHGGQTSCFRRSQNFKHDPGATLCSSPQYG